MRSITTALTFFLGVQIAVASPIARLSGRDTVPSSSDVRHAVSFFQHILEQATPSTELVPGTISGIFNPIYEIIDGTTAGVDLAPSDDDISVWLPGLDQLICLVIGCPRAPSLVLNTLDDVPILDSESAVNEIQGWANGTLPINSKETDVEFSIDDAALVGSYLSGLVTKWSSIVGHVQAEFDTGMVKRSLMEDSLMKRVLISLTEGEVTTICTVIIIIVLL